MYRLVFFYSLIANVLASPIQTRAAPPTVSFSNGTVVGSSGGQVDSFKGIPFAQPPVGTNRLKAPVPLATSFGTIQATGTPTACPQFYVSVDTSNLPSEVVGTLLDTPFGQAIQNAGEDCLTLNVQRPSGTTSSSKLPVVAWIFGGGFELGSTQSYDGTAFVDQSISLGQPVLYVAINYRVGGFGFLAGSELQSEHNTNLGLRDQRLGLQWIQDNIEAFGGDPTKVTLWGESAGSISVFDQTVISGGDNSYNDGSLFRGAIMDSGSLAPALDVASETAQNVYDTVVRNAGCSTTADTLACLRGLDYEDFLTAANSVPAIFSYRSLDLSYVPRPDPNDNFYSISPEAAVANGDFTKVPIIIGDQEDEGTLFSLTLGNVTTTELLTSYVQSYFPNADTDQCAGLVTTYPEDITAGSPFNSGILNEIYPGFKRNAALLGDVTFTLTRRYYLSLVSTQIKAWSYLASYFAGTPILGTFHATDIVDAYEGVQPIPAQTIRTYYVSFVNNLDPNAITTAAPLIDWPQWDNSSGSPQLNNFQLLGNNLINDDFRSESYDYLNSIIPTGAFRV